MSQTTPAWASEARWKKIAIWVTAGSFVLLIFLTFDTLSKVSVGGERVRAYSVINSVYWFLEDESGTEIAGLKLGNIAFYVLTGAVTIVVLVFLLIQTGPGKDSTIWFINEGREYIEAPRWADFGIVAVMLVLGFIGTTRHKKRPCLA